MSPSTPPRLTPSEIETLYEVVANSRTNVVQSVSGLRDALMIPLVTTVPELAELVAEFKRQVPEELANQAEVALARVRDGDRGMYYALMKAILDYGAAQNLSEFFASYTTNNFMRQVFPNASRFATEVNASRYAPGNKGTIVFVANTPFLLVVREAQYLRANGYRVYLVALSGVPQTLTDLVNQSFDGVLAWVTAPDFLRRIISMIEPDIFHVQCWMFQYHLGRLVIENKRNARVVCEFYDLTSIYADRDELVTVWEPPMTDLDLACEEWIFRHADAVVHRFPEPVIDELCAHYGTKVPHMVMHQFPCPEFVHYSTEKYSDRDGMIRLVYAGGLVPKSAQHPEALFPERMHAEAFRKLLQQGLAIDLFTSPFRSTAESGLDALHQLAEEFPHFRFLQGVSPAELAQAISKYDFGLIMTDMDLSKNRNTRHQVKSAAGTKLFTYAEAGLPVIVNAEYEYMAHLAETYGIGFGLHSRDLDRAKEKIGAFDRKKAFENIVAFNQAHGMDKEIHRLIDLYRRVS